MQLEKDLFKKKKKSKTKYIYYTKVNSNEGQRY